MVAGDLEPHPSVAKLRRGFGSRSALHSLLCTDVQEHTRRTFLPPGVCRAAQRRADDAAANGLATSAIDQASVAAEIERDVNASHQAQVEAASKRQFAAAERVAAATQIDVVAAASAAAEQEVDQNGQFAAVEGMGVGEFAHDDEEGGGMHDGEDAINEEEEEGEEEEEVEEEEEEEEDENVENDGYWDSDDDDESLAPDVDEHLDVLDENPSPELWEESSSWEGVNGVWRSWKP